jgi:hypothetical protein
MVTGVPWTEIAFSTMYTQYYFYDVGMMTFDLGAYFNEPQSRMTLQMPPSSKPTTTPLVSTPRPRTSSCPVRCRLAMHGGGAAKVLDIVVLGLESS